MTIHDFVNTLCQEYPSLVDYLGFFEEEMEIETKADKIYDSHMDLDKLLLGIKEGNFFKGKLSINRTSNEDGIFYYSSITFNILLLCELKIFFLKERFLFRNTVSKYISKENKI